MGRRKIEIQPIIHERNRSVTFLKRKNGLFKKAYELGVLCSVDVAVIIFEARPGHEVKLHEYSSSDIRNIVQRQTRHQGDTDSKVPSDFSGSTSKFDDAGDADGDDDIGDEEEDLPAAKPSNRRRGQGRLTLPTSADDYGVQLPPPPPPAHHLHPESGAAALLSVANDRVSNMRDLHPARPNKRTRNARSRSPSEDTLVPALPAINSEWGLPQDNQGMGRYGRNIRHLQNPPPPSPGLSQQQQQQEHQHPHQQYHSMQQQHPGHGFQYTPLFPVSNQVSPPPAFIPLHQDFGPSRGLAGFPNRPGGSGGGPDGGNGYADLHQRMRPAEPSSYDPATYSPNANPMARHAEHHHHHQQSLLSQSPPPPFHGQPPASATVPHRREDRGADNLFGSLLETNERSRQRSGSGTVTGGPGAGLDWPMHEGLAPPDRSGPSGAGGPRGSLEGPGTSNPPNASDSWFNDFLSRSNPINNETQSSSGRRSSSSTWPRNNDNVDARHNKAGDDMGVGLYDGKKESAVRGEGVGVGEDRTGQDITILPSAEDRINEGDGGNIKNEDARSDADKT